MENKENEKDIEIDLGKVQYSMVLKHKYSFQELNKIMIDLSEKVNQILDDNLKKINEENDNNKQQFNLINDEINIKIKEYENIMEVNK